MKSAYERALERMEAESGPTRKLTDAQREQIAEIDTKYDSLIAAERLGLDTKLGAAASPDEVAEIQANVGAEIRRLEERREDEKEAVWNADS